jgi:hypothetical protein
MRRYFGGRVGRQLQFPPDDWIGATAAFAFFTSLIPAIFAAGFFGPTATDDEAVGAGTSGAAAANARRACSSVGPVGSVATFCRFGAGPACWAAMTVAAVGFAGRDGCADDDAGDEAKDDVMESWASLVSMRAIFDSVLPRCQYHEPS